MSSMIEVMNHSLSRRNDGFAVELVGQIPALHRGALRLTRHEADAQDLVQETVTRALERRGQFQPGTNLRAWLFTIQRSLFINAYRRRRQVAWLGSLEDEEQGSAEEALTTTSAEETMLESWVDEDLRGALATLPEHYREVVVLRDVAQRSYAQIAAQLDCPRGTVMSRLHRGRALLRQLLEQRWTQASTRHERGTFTQPLHPVTTRMHHLHAHAPSFGCSPSSVDGARECPKLGSLMCVLSAGEATGGATRGHSGQSRVRARSTKQTPTFVCPRRHPSAYHRSAYRAPPAAGPRRIFISGGGPPTMYM
jgi:RNA polymerase sigma-70 factor (ECF subfamily)